MKRCLLKMARIVAIGFCCLLSLGNNVAAQNYFSLTELTISPATPTNYDIVSVTLSGVQQDSCTFLDFFDANILLYDLDIQMDWDSAANPVCNGSMIPWDTTIVLGILPDGDYVIDLTGTNFTNNSTDPLSFTVAEAPAGSCGSNDVVWVTSAEDEGVGSFREAISCANGNSNVSTILFDIEGGGLHEIRVGETSGLPLPIITGGGILIDATTQPGYGTDGPLVLLTGRYGAFTTLASGLHITGNDCVVLGLDISSFPDNGILVDGAQSVEIGRPNQGNTITRNGVSFDDISIPNNYNIGTGIRLINGVEDCIIVDNYIGTNEFGGEALGNQYCGIFIQSDCDNNRIGGDGIEEGNTIAFNANGVRVESTADFNEIVRNQFECNDSISIKLVGSANESQVAPLITDLSYTEIAGGGIPGDRVDVYFIGQQCSGAPCQGKVFLGEAVINGMGEWILTGPFATGDTLTGGEIITAIATNPNGSSSEFADCGVIVGLSECTDPGGIIWVTNAQDTGVGSLRAAMICADTTLGANDIYFDIPGTGPFTINVGEVTGLPLPNITDAGTILDATTQPGYGVGGNFAPQIILDGQQNTWNTPEDALKILGSYTEIYGLQIVNFPNDAIAVIDAGHVIVGASQKGNVIYNNGATTDVFPGLPGQGPFEGSGIVLRGEARRINIAGNFIGTDYTQTLTSGNEYCGIFIDTDIDFVNIGGSGNKGNIIANNAEGIRIKTESFGMNISQNSFICNDSVAIRLEGNASGNQVPPVWDATSATSLTELSGTATSKDAFVEIYRVDNTACATAPCQGRTYLGSASVVSNTWILNAPFSNGVTLSNGDLLVATAIDNDANTSEFSECHIAADCNLSANGVNIINASCNLANGSFTIATSGGPSPYIYDRGLGEQASATFTNLPAGTYNITVTDAYTCPTETVVTITDPGVPTTSPQLIDPETCDMLNGFVIMNQGSGGTGPYSYNIGNGNQNNNPNFINLAAGDYDLTITDATGCTSIAPVTIPFVTGPTLTIPTVVNETCAIENGSFTAVSTMGTPLYSYNIGGASQNSPTFSGLPSGTYALTVTDDNGCTDTESVTLENIPGPSALTVVSVSPDFCGQSTGMVMVTPTGGSEPYLYDIGFGDDNSSTFANLDGGTYTVTVTDLNQCTAVANVFIPSEDGATLSVASSTDANCGQASGSVTISAINGSSPYAFDIGNGPQNSSTFSGLLADSYTVSVTDNNNCITTLPFTINDIGGPTPSVSSLTNESCEQSNGSVTVFATGGVSPFLYNIGNGFTGNPTFSNLSAGDYTVTISDAANCSSLLPVTITNSGLLAVPNFTYTENNGTVSFINMTQNAGTYSWDYGNGGASSAENPVHTYPMDGTFNACLTAINDCGQMTTCQSITIQTTVNISGIIEKENGEAVSTVKVHYGGTAPTWNNTDGTYAVDVPSNGIPTINMEKDTFYVNGVSSFDVFKIQQHILFVEMLDSPYKIIAADVNRTNSVSSFDTYLMQQVILQNQDTFPNNTSWRFVDKSYIFPVPTNPFAGAIPESVTFNNPSGSQTNVDFIAMKVGDVTLNANPAIIGGPPEEELVMMMEEMNWVKGEEIRVPVRVSTIAELAALQFSFEFDKTVLSFSGITSAGLQGLDENDFNIKNAKDGKISLAWYDKEGEGQDLDENTVLFYLNFTSKSAGQIQEVMTIKPCRNYKNAYQRNGKELLVKSAFVKVEETLAPRFDFKLTAQPNPFETYVNVQIEMPLAAQGQLSVYNVSGQLVYAKSVSLEKGNQQIRLNANNFPAKGIYLIKLEAEDFVKTVRVVSE